ncbi:hypothetical protein [Leifsonia sp. PS1209]|uniref:hypothetical protein n=1 Tax=Leifsonia sp. PS1209 TaxID=2724914 RepID=UPI001442E344|nr:hypothetical protein [Leifsonia sp. PS1209]QIZ99339.1 hypothetical protein HF024_13015 [Leifsonia sp. PS1209]
MLLEEYVADRVRASETAATTRELELLRVIRADDAQEPTGGWLARRRAARAQRAQRAQRRDASAQAASAGASVREAPAAPEGPSAALPDAPSAAVPADPGAPSAAVPAERATQRELQHAGR